MPVAVCGVTVIPVGEELHYVPTHPLLEQWQPIALRGCLAVASLAAGIYAAARMLGLTGLGRQTDLTERAIRRGHGDTELAQALQREADGNSGDRKALTNRAYQSESLSLQVELARRAPDSNKTPTNMQAAYPAHANNSRPTSEKATFIPIGEA